MLAGKKSEELEDKSDKQDENNLAAFEMQSQQFRKAQEDFDDYMDRLKDDIDERARNFEYIEYYDASLRDRLAKDLVSAGDNQDLLDDRRRPLASINPLYAQASVLPPSPSVDDSVSEQLSLNVAQYAANTLSDINGNDPNGTTSSFQNDSQEENNTVEEPVADETMEPAYDVAEEKVDMTNAEQRNSTPDDSAQPDEKKYSVILMSAGVAKLQVVKAIVDTFGLGLAEAKDLVDSAPAPIIEHLSKEADNLKQTIEAAGAEVDLMEE